MPDAQSQPREPAVDYVTRLLEMNPASDPDAIVRARSARLDLDKSATTVETANAEQPQVERRKLVEHLGVIRREFWRLPMDTLQSGLAMLDGHGFPDIEAAVARLRLVASKRMEISKLVAKPGFDMAFFDALKDVLVRSPREAAIAKERTLSLFRNRARLKAGRRTIQWIQREMPDVYSLEADWFNALYRQKAKAPELVIWKRRSASAAGSAGSTSQGNNWIIWVIFVIGLQILRALFQGNR